MGEKVCPVVATIREIKGSAEYKRGGSAVIGGEEYCFDNAMFLYNIRKLELARLEMSRPDLTTLQARPYKYRTFRDIMAEITTQANMQASHMDPMYPIELAHDAVRLFFATLTKKITKSRDANVTIPHLDFTGDPTDAINALVKFVNGVNVNSLLREPSKHAKIQLLRPPQLVEPDLDTPAGVDTTAATSPDEVITALKAALAAEEVVYTYAAAVERSDCAIAAKAAEVVAALVELTGLLKPAV